MDNDLARFESEIQDKALNSRNQEEPSVGKSECFMERNLKKLIVISEGRKKTKDGKGDKKKRSGNSSEEDSAGTIRTGTKKKKQKGSGSVGSTGSGGGTGAKTASGEGWYHFIFFHFI